jgi:hypothetical protein
MSSPTDTFWGSEYHPKNPKLTDAMIADAQEVLGVQLPDALIALLRVQNGGSTRGFIFPTKCRTSWSEDHVPFDELFGIGRKRDSATGNSILDSTYIAEGLSLPPKQVVLAGDGHWWITLDYRRGNTPSVSWIDVEVGEDVPLAASFDEFLAGLLLDETVEDQSGTVRRGGVLCLVWGSLCLLLSWALALGLRLEVNPLCGLATVAGSLVVAFGLGFALHGASLGERRMRFALLAYSVAGVVLAILQLQWLGFFEVYWLLLGL